MIWYPISPAARYPPHTNHNSCSFLLLQDGGFIAEIDGGLCMRASELQLMLGGAIISRWPLAQDAAPGLRANAVDGALQHVKATAEKD